jgi:CRP-like cAMP-binding protein
MDKITLLKSIFVFKGLDENLIEKIAGRFKEVNLPKDQLIFREKEPADALFVIDQGEVLISKELAPGQKKTLAVLGSGNVFGEMAFFSDSPRTANASTSIESVLLKIERSDFLNFINEEPQAGSRILSGLLQVSMDRLEQTSRELATIYHTGNIIASGKQLQEVIANIRDEILIAIPQADGASVYLYNEYNREFDPVAASKESKEIPLDDNIIKSLREKMPGAILTAAQLAKITHEDFCPDSKSVILSPIMKNDDLLGFILLWNNSKGSAFQNGHLLLVITVASQLAESIKNMRYLQEEKDRQRLNSEKMRYH